MATKKEDQKLGFKTDYRLMQVNSIAECSNGSILQYFRPSLSYHLPLRSFCCLFFEWPLKTGFTVNVFMYDYIHMEQTNKQTFSGQKHFRRIKAKQHDSIYYNGITYTGSARALP